MLPPDFWLHLADRELGDVDEAFEIVETSARKSCGRVVGERLHREMPALATGRRSIRTA